MTTNHVITSRSNTSDDHSKRTSGSMVAIDPGIYKIGLAAFNGSNLVDYTVKTVPRLPLVRDRLIRLEKVLNQYLEEKRPTAIAIEKTNFSTSNHNGLLVLAHYKILAVARRHRIPVAEYAPISVRKAVCGNGHATKQDVVKILISRYPELRVFSGANRRYKEQHFFNLFDAVAVGLTYLGTHVSKGRHR